LGQFALACVDNATVSKRRVMIALRMVGLAHPSATFHLYRMATRFCTLSKTCGYVL
jgi:hypothetical protein